MTSLRDSLAVLKTAMDPAPVEEPVEKLLSIALTLQKKPTRDLVKSAAPDPPHYREASSEARSCGTCKMFDDGRCWGYGNREVDADHVCDSWSDDVTKEAEATRIPAGDPRRGRIHPGEWTADEARSMAAAARAKKLKEETDPEKLEEAHEHAESHVERAVVEHRMAQLRTEHSVPGRLSDEELERTNADLAFSKKALTAAGRKALRKQLEPTLRSNAERSVADPYAVGRALEEEVRGTARFRRLYAKFTELAARHQAARNVTYEAQQAVWNAPTPAAERKLTAARTRAFEKAGKARDAVNEVQAEMNQMILAARTEANLERTRRRMLAAKRAEIAQAVAGALDTEEARHVQRHEGQVRQFSDSIAAHKRSFSLARRRAAEVRRVTPKFEAQNLGKLDAAVRGKNGQTRAIFLEGSVFDDDVAYVDHLKQRVWRERNELRVKMSDGAEPAALRALVPVAIARGASPEDPEAGRRYVANAILRGIQEDPTDPGKYATTLPIGTTLRSLTPAEVKQVLGAWERKKLLSWERAKSKGEWADASEARFRVIGEVRREKEQTVIDALKGAGAKITDNELEVPEYRSWYKAEGGKRYTVNLGGGKRVHYVPHGAIQEDVKDYTHTVTLDPKTIEAKATAALDALLDERTTPRSELYAVHAVYPNGQRYYRGIFPKQNVHPDALTGKPPKGYTGDVYYNVAERADASDLANDHNWTQRGRKGYVKRATLEQVEEARAAVAKLGARSKPIVWREHGGKEITPTSVLTSHVKHISGLNASEKRQIERMADVIAPTLTHKKERKERVQKTPHQAPFSERGVLRFENMGSTEAVKTMKKLGLAKAAVSSVPYNVIQRGEHRLGRVTPLLHDYATGKEHLELPDGWGVVHGMTGVRDDADALQRLKNLIDTGGLKSIAERRRMGIRIHSMSQLGDIGSGIDQGVPTTLGSKSYGHHVAFQMRPEIMHRRDVFFAPTDYGGGQNRWANYTHYANSIGQPNIFTPPSHQTRLAHMRHINANSSNEAVFKHEIGWNDIDSVHVESAIFRQAQKLVNDAKKRGALPEHVRVIEVGGKTGPANFGVSIPTRAREIRAGQ